jgi:hypothetical protein
MLLYHQHLADTPSLIEGRLLLIEVDIQAIADTYIASSGLPGFQNYSDLLTVGKGCIPPNSRVGIKYTVSSVPYYMPDIKGVEGNFYAIAPSEVTIGGVKRGDFGIHFDANLPGSAGCIVLRTAVGWQAFELAMKRLSVVDTSISLLVSYSR